MILSLTEFLIHPVYLQVGMSGQLNSLGLVKYMSDSVAQTLASANLSWPASFGLLQVSVFPALPAFVSSPEETEYRFSFFEGCFGQVECTVRRGRRLEFCHKGGADQGDLICYDLEVRRTFWSGLQWKPTGWTAQRRSSRELGKASPFLAAWCFFLARFTPPFFKTIRLNWGLHS